MEAHPKVLAKDLIVGFTSPTYIANITHVDFAVRRGVTYMIHPTFGGRNIFLFINLVDYALARMT